MHLTLKKFPLFDSHVHIIDKRFPLIENNGYIPDEFNCENYLECMASYDLRGGAIVSGSFQSFDQSYLIEALNQLGNGFVGITQLPATVTDQEIQDLAKHGVRAVRFNLRRGGSESLENLESMALRVHQIAAWHIELHVDSKQLPDLYPLLIQLPSISIDHLGLSKTEFKTVLKLAEKGARIKATGFSRVDFDVKQALQDIYSANPESLMFGTDLPSTRAPSVFSDDDFVLVADTLGEPAAFDVFSENAINFYKPGKIV